MWTKIALFALIVVGSISFTQETQAQSNGWYPRVIARGDDREIIRATPMELRPNRPMHFYGNSVRRQFHRTGVVPNRARRSRGRRN